MQNANACDSAARRAISSRVFRGTAKVSLKKNAKFCEIQKEQTENVKKNIEVNVTDEYRYSRLKIWNSRNCNS